jgi:alpha-N-arabinofuranosidase
MDYCLSPKGSTTLALEREKNGHPEPFDIPFWGIGNENWGGHEIGAKTVEQWGPLVRESAKMMRGTDHSIYLFAAALPNEGWTLPLLKTAGYLLDYVSVHGYYVRRMAPYVECMARSARPEADIARTIKVLEKAGFGGGKVGIAFDEWNLRSWYHPGLGKFRRDDRVDYAARRENDIASTYTMADALFTATFLNACLRHCDIVKMANFSPIVNTRGAIFVHKDGILKRTTYYVFKMYTNLLEANVMPVDVKCGVISNGKDSAPLVDAILTVSDDGKRRVLAVVNKSPDSVVSFDMSSLTAATVLNSTVLDGDSPDAYNDIGAENRVVPRKTVMKVNGGKVSLAPHSLNVIEL